MLGNGEKMGVGDGEGRRTGSFNVVYLIIEKLHTDTNTEESFTSKDKYSKEVVPTS